MIPEQVFQNSRSSSCTRSGILFPISIVSIGIVSDKLFKFPFGKLINKSQSQFAQIGFCKAVDIPFDPVRQFFTILRLFLNRRVDSRFVR